MKLLALREDAYDDGFADGRSEGETQGKNRMARLFQILLGEKKYDDLNRATTDSAYCDSLLEAYGI